MNIAEALRTAAERLKQEPIGPPRMAAEALLAHVMQRERAYFYAHPEQELTPELERSFQAAVARRAAGEPLQYITGKQEFWGMEFLVDPSVLIPRPETEHLVEAALEAAHGWLTAAEGVVPLRIADVGTGSGCVALALASELPEAKIFAFDISIDALRMAERNAAHIDAQLDGQFGAKEQAQSIGTRAEKRGNLAERVRFIGGDLLAPAIERGMQFEIVASNPPYVGLNEADKVQREVREHEPRVAVFGGEQGMDIYRRLIPQAMEVLVPGGWLALEIGYSIEQPVRELLAQWEQVSSVPDLQGIPRVVRAQKPV